MRWFLFILLLFLVGCQSAPSKTTDTHSRSLPDLKARQQFLARYAKLPTAVQDLVFHVVYHDNSGGGLPGPSDWDIRVLAKVSEADLGAWTAGLAAASEKIDMAWVGDLADWELGQAEQYSGEGFVLLVFPQERVVAKRWFTL